MPKKKKEILWHKRKAKMMSAHVLRSHASIQPVSTPELAIQDRKTQRKIRLAVSLSQQIKKAVSEIL